MEPSSYQTTERTLKWLSARNKENCDISQEISSLEIHRFHKLINAVSIKIR